MSAIMRASCGASPTTVVRLDGGRVMETGGLELLDQADLDAL